VAVAFLSKPIFFFFFFLLDVMHHYQKMVLDLFETDNAIIQYIYIYAVVSKLNNKVGKIRETSLFYKFLYYCSNKYPIEEIMLRRSTVNSKKVRLK
jgi:hypothetical protein